MDEHTAEKAAPIRVLLLDDHEMMVSGLAAALGGTEGIEVVGAGTTIAEVVDAAREVQPDVALVDYRLPDGTGADATRGVHEVSPDTAVIVITAFDAPDIVAGAIDAGCAGFLRKNESLDELVAGVRAVAGGDPWFAPELLAGLVTRLRNPEPTPGSDLSKRELEVLRLLAEGKAASAIASELYISVNTARNHIQKILMKLGAHSKLEAVAIALRHNIISLGESDDRVP